MTPYSDRAYLDLSYMEGKGCVRCGDSKCEPAHYSGLYSDQLGKGGSQKSADLVVADLCRKCHAYFDLYLGGNDDIRAAEFLLLCWRTLLRNVAMGLAEVRVLRSLPGRSIVPAAAVAAHNRPKKSKGNTASPKKMFPRTRPW